MKKENLLATKKKKTLITSVDIDLYDTATKNLNTISGMYLMFWPKMKVVGLMVLADLVDEPTNKQTEDHTLLII